MFGKRVPLIRLFGFEVRFDLSWLILVALIVWTLSAGYFPGAYSDLSAGTYFWMGVLGAIGLVVSVVLHELSHSLVARRFGIEIHGITLFVFGGAAEMTAEPPNARAEFFMAAAGPAASLVLAAVFSVLQGAAESAGVPDAFTGVLGYVSGANVILALFNLVPAFPLDGGRMLRALLWGWRGDLKWATRIAANIGGGFGLGLILLGVVNILGGNSVGGMWYFLIGLFVRAAAAGSYQQLLTRETLGGVPVTRFMRRDPITATPDTRLSDLVETHFLQHYLKLVPVVANGRLLGLVDVRAVKAIPREAWDNRRVADILESVSAENTVRPDMDAIAALELIQRTGRSRLLVAEGDRLVGIVTLKDMLNALTMRLDFPDLPQARSGGSGALAGR